MKNIKWHQFAIVAFLIWIVNQITSVKTKPVAIAISLFVIVFLFQSCGSSCARTKRYWRSHRNVYVEPKRDTTNTIQLARQFYVVNNQIVMMDNRNDY